MQRHRTNQHKHNPVRGVQMVFDSNNKCFYGPHLFKEGLINGRWLINNYFFSNYLFPSPIWGEAMVKKSVLESMNYLDKNFGFYADVDLWLNILQNHDAYYCHEHLIHCPSKEMVPNLFDNRLIKSSFILMDIHYKHRTRFYKNKLTYLMRILFFYFQCIMNNIHINLIIQKNKNLETLLNVGVYTLSHKIFLLPIWILLLPLKICFLIMNSIKILQLKLTHE